VTMQTASLKDEEARTVMTEMQGRIAAIGQIHRRLYTSDDVRFVDMGTYLQGLVEELQGALKGDGRSYSIKLNAENIPVATDKAVSLGMIVTELVTNAYKYAYPKSTKGEIRIRFERHDKELLSICVEDDGVGWSGKNGSNGTGLGTKIINSMARALGGPVDIDAKHKGTRVLLRFTPT
jgi:two-component sensor histidine kinase